MKLNAYSIYDKKAASYMRPFFLQNESVAVRAISSTILENPELSKHPADYQLSHLGQFDEETGVITSQAVSVIAEIQTLYDSAKAAQENTNQTSLPLNLPPS